MAQITYEGKTVDVAEDWRLGELIEAENALGIDMETARGGAKMALVLYISVRRAEPTLPIDALAGKVMRMEIASLADDDDEDGGKGESPLDDDTAAEPQESASLETGGQPTTGHLRSAS